MSEPAAQRPAFVRTTTYEVWMRLPEQEWRPWANGFIEEWQAQEEANRLTTQGVRAGLTPRKVRIARRTITIDWIGDETDA